MRKIMLALAVSGSGRLSLVQSHVRVPEEEASVFDGLD
jgi:hypothetical protein